MPKIVDHEQKKAEILERCFALFADRGYAALSMRGICRSLGVTTGTLYYYFDGKQDLFEQLIRFMTLQQVMLASAELGDGANQAESLAALERYLEQNGTVLQQLLQIGLEYRRHQSDGDADALLSSAIGIYQQAIQDKLEVEDTATAQLILSVILGFLLQNMLLVEPLGLTAHIAEIRRLVTRAPAPPANATKTT